MKVCDRTPGIPRSIDLNKRTCSPEANHGRRDSILCFGSAKRDLCKNPVVLLAILVEPDAAKRSITLHCLDRHPRPARVQLNHVTWLES
jgi:hypothetical protein